MIRSTPEACADGTSRPTSSALTYRGWCSAAHAADTPVPIACALDVTEARRHASHVARHADRSLFPIRVRCTCFDCLESLRAEVEKVVKQQGRLQLLELPAVSRLRSKAHLELRKRSFGGLHVQGGPCVWCEEHVPQGSSMCSKPVHALRRLGVPSATNYWDTPPDVDNSVQLRLTVTGVDQQLRDCGELEVDVSVESCYPLLLPDDVRSTFAAAHVDEAMRVKLWHDAPAQKNCDGLVHSAADLRARFVIGQPLPRMLVHVADDVGMGLQPEGSPASRQPKLSAEALSQGQVIDTADDAGVGLQPVGSPASWQPESSAEALSPDQFVSISNDSPEALAPDQVIKTANEAVLLSGVLFNFHGVDASKFHAQPNQCV